MEFYRNGEEEQAEIQMKQMILGVGEVTLHFLPYSFVYLLEICKVNLKNKRVARFAPNLNRTEPKFRRDLSIN